MENFNISLLNNVGAEETVAHEEIHNEKILIMHTK